MVMKSRDGALKLKRFEAEEKRRKVADIESMINEFEQMAADLDRQIAVYEGTIQPRAQRIVMVTQDSYAAGKSSLLDLLDAQRSLIALRRMVADFRVSRAKQLADIEAATAMVISEK